MWLTEGNETKGTQWVLSFLLRYLRYLLYDSASSPKNRILFMKNYITAVLTLITSLSLFAADAPAVPKAGDKAPLFTGQDQDGKTFK